MSKYHSKTCVGCGSKDDLTWHHVKPFTQRFGKKGGFQIRLCLSCHRHIHTRMTNEDLVLRFLMERGKRGRLRHRKPQATINEYQVFLSANTEIAHSE